MTETTAASDCGRDRACSLSPGKLTAHQNQRTNNFRKTKQFIYNNVLSTMTSFQPKIITHAKKQESVTQSWGVGVRVGGVVVRNWLSVGPDAEYRFLNLKKKPL